MVVDKKYNSLLLNELRIDCLWTEMDGNSEPLNE
jgi:hypothetical protein